MMTSRLFRLLLIVASLLATTGCKDSGKRQVVKIGYMLCNSEQETTQRFLPLTRYLSDKVGVDFVMAPTDPEDFEKRLKNNEFAFTHTNSVLYVILRENLGVELVASEKRGAFGTRTAGAIIARKGSGIEKLSDIRESVWSSGQCWRQQVISRNTT
jgi:phosphonate transport system substrate-binding protein